MRRSWSFGVLALLPAGTAIAQAPPLDARPPQRRMTVVSSGRLRYDSNVLRGFRGPVGSATRHKADYNAAPEVQLDILQPLSRQALFLNGTIGYDFYRYNKRLERERISLTGGAELRAGARCSARPAVSYQRSLSDLGDLVGTTAAAQRVNVQETVDYGVDALCGGVFGLTAGGGYHHSETRNTAPFRRQLDVINDTYTANVGLSSRTIGNFALYGTYLDGNYPNRVPGGAIDPGSGIRSYSGGLRYDRRLGTYLAASVSAGVTRVDPRTAGLPKFTGLSYNGDISYTLDPVSVKLGFSRSAQQSNLIQSSYSIVTEFSGAAEYALSSDLVLTGSALYGRRRFVQAPGPAGPVPNRRLRDRTLSGTLGLRYKLTSDISLTAEAGYTERRAEPADFDYTSTQATVSLRWNI